MRVHDELPAADRRHRFLASGGPSPAAVADSILAPGVIAVGVEASGRLVGVGHAVQERERGTAGIALVVAHGAQHNGVGTLLIEELVKRARAAGLRMLLALVAAENADVLRVLYDLGLPVVRLASGSDLLLGIELGDCSPQAPAGFADRMAQRMRAANAAGLRPILAPRSVAVVGSHRPGSVGRALLDRVRSGGFTGAVTAVNPHGAPEPGVAWAGSVDQLPDVVDLAVLAVPGPAVLDVAGRCGDRGVRALLVVSSGVPAELLREVAARHGMRLVGPNCLGLTNTDPAVALDALFAGLRPPGPRPVGTIGVAAQSGGVVVAQLADLDRLGLGASTVVSLGDAPDVGPDDLLAWWAGDGRTRAAVLHSEALRRPAGFAELARRVAPDLALVAVRAGSSAAGRRAAATHTASTATSRAVLDAQLRRGRIAAVDSLAEATELLAAFCWCPPVLGSQVAVVSNAGGLGVLAADALARESLGSARLTPLTQDRLQDRLPVGAAVRGPVDTTAVVPAATFADVVELVHADPGVHAVLAVGVATDLGDPLAEMRAPDGGAPVLVVRPGQGAGVEVMHIGGGRLPCYAEVGAAARVVSHLFRRSRRLADPVEAPEPDRMNGNRLLARARSATDDGGWMEALSVQQLLCAAGIPVAQLQLAADVDTAVARRRELGGPVVLKAVVPGLVHRSRAGGVVVGVRSDAGVRDAFGAFDERFGAALEGVLVQPFVRPGAELLASEPPAGAARRPYALGSSETGGLADADRPIAVTTRTFGHPASRRPEGT
ncbi:GNAT family N-acetyltransferase [Pseudonocardia sp. RS11V-5]|uniref:GNAT family N-acetyltransferase n=1 Tax=Pseudonocardia terrae TaxID=2905831 RepID=UPI001E634107|nr:GNAT family N-acetyltransferase [Pseudonocardia terrae]MCE3555153.1 GNAT family N-acetyltransferase [Pseudonocardia terrae]